MAKKSDLGSKKLIGLAPTNWVRWIIPRTQIQANKILSTDFQWIGRDTDAIIEVQDPEMGKFLVVNELQLRYDNNMPLRMRAYAALAQEKYRLPIYPVLINILQPTPGVVIKSSYESDFLGIKVRQDYKVINLWEIDVNLVFEQPLPTLLPFVPILKGGNNTQIITEAVQQLRQNDDLKDLEPLLGFFASFVIKSETILQILRWDMAVLLESPWYQEIYAKGEQKGLQQGVQQGIESLRNTVTMILRFRFQVDPPANIIDKLNFINNLEQLENISQSAITSNSLGDFEEFLNGISIESTTESNPTISIE